VATGLENPNARVSDSRVGMAGPASLAPPGEI
jgi:hypothetical protein